jgi:hypothetical protein
VPPRQVARRGRCRGTSLPFFLFEFEQGTNPPLNTRHECILAAVSAQVEPLTQTHPQGDLYTLAGNCSVKDTSGSNSRLDFRMWPTPKRNPCFTGCAISHGGQSGQPAFSRDADGSYVIHGVLSRGPPQTKCRGYGEAPQRRGLSSGPSPLSQRRRRLARNLPACALAWAPAFASACLWYVRARPPRLASRARAD